MDFPQHSNDTVAKKVQNLYLGRIRQFNDPTGPYAGLNLPQFFDRVRTDDKTFIKMKVYSVPDLKRPSFSEMKEQAKRNWKPAQKGDEFGPSWSTHWFRIELKVPEDWKYSEAPLFYFDSSDEGMVYDDDGHPITGINAEINRGFFPISQERADKNGWQVIYIETSCNNITGVGTPPDPNRRFRLNVADLVVPNALARALNLDFQIIGDAAREFPENSWQRNDAFTLLNDIIDCFDAADPEKSIEKGRTMARKYLGRAVDSEKVYEKILPNQRPLVWGVGNCHIDTAWLWPYAETRRKIARSWTAQMKLMDKYPEYVFVASQAVQFQWLKEDHPDLFQELKKYVVRGQFVPIGGSWVECDTNMPNGESLVRQMWLGQNFFLREFGIQSEVFWLPDTFGYAPQLPQICRQAEQPFFLTQKLSWNNINQFPLSTFRWHGLDNSQVLCHMPPTNTYTAEANFGDVKRSIEQHKNLDTSQSSLLLFGYGDGGGGPTEEMLEKLRRCRAIANEVDLLPTVTMGPKKTPAEFFSSILEDTDKGHNLPTWKGELYLEYHRGTYTTQAAIKRKNRQSEVLMRDLELFATSASIKCPDDYEYPYREIESLWQKVCLNQFHDVLPGSGIGMIYEDANRIYQEIWCEGSKLVKEALEALGYEIVDHNDADGHYLSLAISGVNECATADPRGQLEYEEKIPHNAGLSIKNKSKKFELENDRFTITFENGNLSFMHDKKARRDVIEFKDANRFLLFEDQPLNFPAWDTEQYATEKFKVLMPQEWRKVDERSAELLWKFGKSSIHQRVVLHESYLEFDTEVDWHETYQFLKVEFDVGINNDFASYETSFGIQRRPTHFNTSWDAAKFEVCGHRFADLSDWNYGVALLNDCKYGYSIHGSLMRLSCLRSPKSPDPNADMGKHQFRYALMPHEGPLSPQVVHMAEFFNHPHYWVKNPHQKRPDLLSKRQTPHIFMVEGDSSIIVSAIKRADEDQFTDESQVIVRLYETMGGKARGRLASILPIAAAKAVNVLEKSLGEELDILTNTDETKKSYPDYVPIELNAFEIKSICITLA